MSDGRQRLSGAKRKRKHEKEAELKKQSGSIKKCLTSSSSSSLEISNTIVVVQPSEVFDTSLVVEATVSSEIAVIKSVIENVESNVCRDLENQNSFNSFSNISTDPAEWLLTINNDFKTLLVD